MNTINDVLTPLQTKIAFVSANNPGGGGGGIVPQTGDAIGFVLAIIAALAVVCVATYSIVSRQKIASAKSAGIVNTDISFMQKSRRRITLALSAVIAICLASLVWIYSPLHSAIAGTDGDVTGSDTVYAHVDETTGAVTVDDGVIVNNTNSDLYITSSTLKFVETDEDKVTAPSDIKLSVAGLDSTLFNGSVGEKWTEKDGDIVLKTTLPAGKQTPLHFAISNLNVQDARNLIGQTAYYFELEEAPCYTINYFANGADEGSVPNAGIMKESDESIAIAGNTQGLDYWGFNFIGWNTKADGTGTDYEAGVLYREKASLNLYAKWQENADVNITYKVDPDHKGGKVKLLNSAGTESEDSVSESVAPRTGDPKGATIINVVNDDFAFIGWYTESGESLGNAKVVKPERNDHKCWETTTYVARFEKVVKANITGESEDAHRGSVVSEISKDIYTGSKYIVTTQGQDSIITIYDLNDTSKYQQIIASGEGNYKFDHWVYTDSKGTEHVVGSEGFIVGDMKFVAHFYSENEVNITISVSDDAVLGHYGVFSYDSDEPTIIKELTNVDSSQDSLAKLEAIANPDDLYDHKFAYWEFDFNDGLAPVKVTEAEYTPTLATLGKTHWGNGMTITCYFIAPLAIYTANDSTMRFVYDTSYYPSGENGQVVFPVIPDSYYNPADKWTSNFPAWVNYDGTFMVYPRNIIFEESFKGYEELESTSYWFSSQLSRLDLQTDIARSLFYNGVPMSDAPLNYLNGDTQPRVIQNVEGLENVYTENITDTSYMFASRNRNDLPLESLDFSKWNLPKVQDMSYMFAGNLFLNDLKLPSDIEGHYFGTTAQNMSFMFSQCASLKTFDCNGTFGENVLNCVGMFSMCKSLGEFNTGQHFGSNAIHTGAMFYNCSRLYEFTMGEKFGQLTQYTAYYDNVSGEFYGMFENCSVLRKVNFNNYFGRALKDAARMFRYCYSLSSVDFTNFYLTDYYDEQGDYAAQMLEACYSLMEIKVGTNFTYYFQGDGYDDNLCVEFDEWYVSDYGTQIYDAYYDLPRTSDIKHSIACTYRIRAPKAVYDKTQSTFTFTYDHTVYSAPDVDVYYVPASTGFQAGHDQLLGSQVVSGKKSNSLASDAVNMALLPPWYRFTGEEPVFELADSSLATKIDYLTSNDNQSMSLAMTLSKFECMVDAKTVIFNSSFASYSKLEGTSLWFIADSYGKQSFQNFEGLINIPYKNLVTTACMFGGFSYEMMSSYYNWAEMSQVNYVATYFERILDFILYQKGAAVSGMSSYKFDQLGSKYDTYGTSVRELDLSNFAPLVWGAKDSLKINDLSALLANCCGLQKVTLPKDEDYAYKNSSSKDKMGKKLDAEYNKAMAQNAYSLISGEPNYSGGLNGFFLNCESLNTIENLPALFRHYNTIVLNEDSDRFYMIYRMFSGCRSLEAVDLRDVPAYNIQEGANGPWIFQGLFDNCDNLTTIYTYDGYNEMFVDFHQAFVWPREFAVFGLPDFAEDDNPWTLYYRVNPRPIKLFGDIDQNSTSVAEEGVEINGDDDYPTKFNADLTTVDIPFYQTALGEVYLSGKFVRNNQDGYTLGFDVSEEQAGSIYYTNDNAEEKTEVTDMNFVTTTKYFVYGSELFVNGIGISAKAADGYKFNHWEINGHMISSYKDAGEVNAINEDATFVACFDAEGLTPKAVYRQENGATSLTFVYDKKTPEQIMAEDNTVLDVYIVNPNTYFENKYVASLPSWMKLVYKGQEGKLDVEDSAREVVKGEQLLGRAYYSEGQPTYRDASGIINGKILGPGDVVADHIETDYRKIEDIGGNAYYLWNDHGFKEVIYNDSWHLEWAIHPESVIFDSSFKYYDGLESISGWFMADDNGLQPVKHFYSKDSNGLHDGDRAFENLNTTNIQDVKYAFGGIAYPSGRVRSMDTSAIGEFIQGLTDDSRLAPQPGFVSYGNSFETYGRSITELNLKSFDMSNIKSLDYMFANALMLEKVIFPEPAPGSTTILSNCKSMAGLFYQCESLKNDSSFVGMNKFDTSNVECMDAMFYSCSGLTSLDLTNFNTENLTYDYWNNAQNYNPRSSDVDYDVSAIQNTWGMFYECTRLCELKVQSKYDANWWQNGNLTHLSGWTINLSDDGPSGGCLPNYNYGFDDNYWLAGNKPVENTSWLPYSEQSMANGIRPEDADKINTGRYHLAQEIEDYDVNFVVDDTDNFGTINGLQETAYSFVKTANIHMDPYKENTIWADNLVYVAEPISDDCAFMYWTYGDGFGPLEGEVVQNDLMINFDSNNYEPVTFVAHFTNDTRTAKAIFTASNGQGNLNFVYDEKTYEPGKDGVLTVYNVNPNCNSYNLPSWYKFKQESGLSGDDHQLYSVDSIIESNAPGGVSVTFDESFKAYDQLKSMSCWFIPCVSNLNNDILYVPFSNNPFVTTQADEVEFGLDLTNVNTASLENVSYMFGGHDSVSDYGGTTLNKITLTMPEQFKTTSLKAWFANCVRLTDIEFTNSFDSSNVTNMSYMFYNCPNLVYNYPGSTVDLGRILNKFNTGKVTDMSYMFAQTQTVYAQFEKPVIDPRYPGEEKTYDINIYFPGGGNFTTGNVENFEGMFSGFYNAKSITITGNFRIDAIDSEKGISMQFMFGGNPYLEKVCLPTSFDTSKVIFMGGMFAGDYRLGYVAPDAGSDPDPTKFKTTSECIIVGDPALKRSLMLDSVIDMAEMFSYCSSLKGFDLPKKRCTVVDGGKIVGQILDACNMFVGCSSLQTIDLTNYYISESYVYALRPYKVSTTSSTISVSPDGTSWSATFVMSHAPFKLCGPTDLSSLDTLILGSNIDTSDNYWLQWNTSIQLADALYNSHDIGSLNWFELPDSSDNIAVAKDIDNNRLGLAAAWINKDTAHCVGNLSQWPIALEEGALPKTGVENPYGTYLKQKVGIVIGAGNSSGNTYEYVNGLEVNSTNFDSGSYLTFGYDNGFKASYSTLGVPGLDFELTVALKFTSTENTSISNTQYIHFDCSISHVYWKYTLADAEGIVSEPYSVSEIVTDQDIQQLFENEEIIVTPGAINFSTINKRNYKNEILKDELEASSIDTNNDYIEGSLDDDESLEDALEASAAESSAFEELANTEEPVGELATAALSLLSFTVPWEFFTMCLDIIF